jgi:Spy/CpxP family protein refolding chaperone
MKKVFVMMLLAVGLTAFAQEKKQAANRAEMEKLSPEQRNELRLKKLTMELNLNDNQQKEIGKIIAEQTTKREAMMTERKANKEKGVKPSADERFARESKKLDEEKAMQDRIRKILTPDQYKKWEDRQNDRKDKMREHRRRRGDKKQDSKE